MRKKSYIFVISFIFLFSSSPITYALTFDNTHINSSRNKNAAITPTPTVIPTHKVSPTQKVSPTDVLSPTPTKVITNQVTVTPSLTPTSTPAVIASSQQTVTPQNNFEKTAENMTQNTAAKVTKKTSVLQETNELNDYGDTITIPQAALAQKADGTNYYKNETLSHDVTVRLLLLASFLLSFGIGILKMPSIQRRYAGFKEQRQLERPFSIPYFRLY